MSLPDFETLKAMAEHGDGELEKLLQAEMENILQGMSQERQRKLLGWQFQMNCQKELSRNPEDYYVRLSNMLCLSYQKILFELEEIKAQMASLPTSTSTSTSTSLLHKESGEVVPFQGLSCE